MTAIGVQQVARPLPCRNHRRSFFEVFIRGLIVLCAAIAVLLSSISVCDGRWLLAHGKLFGLWHFCIVNNFSDPACTTDLDLAGVEGLRLGMIFCRSALSFAVVSAIFGLELMMVSLICEDVLSRRKWFLGSVLVVVSFLLSSGGVFAFLVILRNYVTFTGFTLTYWCQFTAVFLFFLNGISGLHINNITDPWNRQSLGKV
ncbi:voltage-dependent calcium channel gamma-like subunit [Ambystoma mexicanum]|uniref:voltage-dependent calcium channel gamma-like subunit n=1 Tax=Ambystoma mexicanum TaxID=8296 RepID=UPI0037E83385